LRVSRLKKGRPGILRRLAWVVIFCFLFYLEKRENQTKTIEQPFSHEKLAEDHSHTNTSRTNNSRINNSRKTITHQHVQTKNAAMQLRRFFVIEY
jgi:hypothetical protein